MTYKLPKPMISIIGLQSDIFTRAHVQEIADAAYVAGQRDMLARCVAVCESRITPGTGSRDILMGAVYEMKELLNEQH